MNRFLYLDKDNFKIFFITSIIYSSFIFSSLMPLLLVVIFTFKITKKNIIFLLLVTILSIPVFYIDFKSGLQYLTYSYTIFSFSLYISHYYIKYLGNFTLITLIIFISTLLANHYSVGDFNSVITFHDRFWPILPNNLDINANTIGIFSAFMIIYFLLKRYYIFSLMPITFLLLSQSRSSVLFIIIFTIVYYKISFKNLISLTIIGLIVFNIIKNTSFMDRFQESGANSRDIIYINYWRLIRDQFPLGWNVDQLSKFTMHIGPLDNLYLQLLMKFGLSGLTLIILIILFLIFNKKNVSRIGVAIILAFFGLGVVESSFLSNALNLTIFSGAFFYNSKHSKL